MLLKGFKMHIRRKLIKTAAAVLSAGMAGIFAVAGYYSSKLPASMTAETSSEIRIAQYPELSCSPGAEDGVLPAGAFPGTRQVTFSLFGAVPVKTVTVREAEPPVLTVGGAPFGIKLLMDGVMVTELGDVTDISGGTACPAADAGIEVGDVIKTAGGRPILSNSALQEVISESGGKDVSITVVRDGEESTVFLRPVFSGNSGTWRGGMWVRDSVAGIGTMTFINKATGEFAGLGHPICDSDTGGLVPLYSGEAVPVSITDAQKGEKGIPGELRGVFMKGKTYGRLYRNSSCGVFGRLTDDAVKELCEGCEEFIMGYRQDVAAGPAEIYSTLGGTSPEKYSAEIESVDLSGKNSGKDMVIRITDERLLEKAGGIVQGMSGSPVIQNGRLIGAVTHVFVADPTRGYAVFAETMAEYLEG